jgi:type I restriction enzyme M protein
VERVLNMCGMRSDDDYLDRVDAKAGKKSVKARSSIKTEILFCERVWHFLKPGTGRAAIVLPDGILTNGSLQGVRDWLLAKFQLLAVISLPQEAFQHSGAGVKASIAFVRTRLSGRSYAVELGTRPDTAHDDGQHSPATYQR